VVSKRGLRVSLSQTSKWQVQFAANIINSGGVIAHPTEAVWGLACHPGDERAVHKILEIKKRPIKKGLILVTGDARHFAHILNGLPEALLERFLSPVSRPTTWLVPDKMDRVPAHIKGEFSSVALRLTTHPLVVELTRRVGAPLISTSANPAGKSPAMNLREARDYFRGQLDYLLPGYLGGHDKPSEIKDLVSGQVIRL
jgi:L-threonylcarbamoyladenylate synthase